MKLHIVYFTTVACLCCLVGFAPATIVIDDFSTAQSVHQSTDQSVTGPGILGQGRYVRTTDYTTVEINTTYPKQATFSTTTDFLSAYLFYEGIGSDGLNNMDLTEDGQNTGFKVKITDIAPVEAFVIITIRYNNDQFADLSFQTNQPQDLFFPFEDFSIAIEAGLGTEFISLDYPVYSAAETPVDFTKVNSIILRVSSYDNLSSITLGSFEIIPEPGTMLLLAAGAIAIRRKQK